jgi:hypothetical protein
MTRKVKKIVTMKEHSLLTAKKLVEDLMDEVDKYEIIVGKEESKALLANIMLLFVGSWTGRALFTKDPLDTTREEKGETKQKQFNEVCTNIEDAVGTGVSSAIRLFTEADVEVWCSISKVPESANKKPC